MMKTYEKYKPSGIEWIGEIPEHWDMKKVSRSFNTIGSGTTPTAGNPVYYTDGTIDWVNTGDLNDGILTACKKKVTKQAFDEFSTLKIYPKGTLLIAMYGATIGKVSLLDFEACTNQACCALSDSSIFNQKYLLYWFLSNKPHIINLSYGGGQPNISQDIVKSLKITFPPIAEQTAIADYLDEKTAEIDKLIANKKRLIELLKEERTAIINKAVTKGINADAKLKPSGIDWLGDIPEHWEVKRLKYFVTVKARLGWKGLKADEYVTEGFGFLSTPNIKYKEIDFENINYITKERYYESPEIMLEIDDVLLAKDGSTLGTVNVVKNLPFASTVNSSIAVLRIRHKNRIFAAFLKLFIESDFTQNVIQRIKAGMGVPHLFQADIKEFELLLPPIEEQKEIGEFIESKTNEIDSTISKIEKEIELIKEYRTALISEVVTGKIKVA